ncbi:MAG: hypothetical protein GY822_02730 [Deltaproteobacteria bacterium]|nr:hypothetical protein [Deltaproteobacteria bacterium]
MVSLQGQNASFYGMPQFRFVSSLTKDGTTDTVDNVTMPLPAQFDGSVDAAAANHSSRLKGGRPVLQIPPSAEVDGYLAVWVELINVATTNACYGSPYTPTDGSEYQRDFGYFLVTGDVEIGDRFYAGFAGRFADGTDSAAQSCDDTRCDDTRCDDTRCDDTRCDDTRCDDTRCGDNRSTDNVFTSISGVMDIGFDVYRLHPRTINDVQGVTLSTAVCD